MAQQLNLFGVPDIQESTCQVPCGDHSIWDALEAGEVTRAECWVSQVINKHSNWESGRSHAKSYSGLSTSAGMPRASVIACINSLVEKGWIQKSVRNKLEKHYQNTANTYHLTHYKCEQHAIPLDKDGCPLKCAVPTGQGSVYQMVEDGVIHWKEALYWLRSKIESESAPYFNHATMTAQIATKMEIPVSTTWRTSALPSSLPFIQATSVLIVETSWRSSLNSSRSS